jgi:hypothetical protein
VSDFVKVVSDKVKERLMTTIHQMPCKKSLLRSSSFLYFFRRPFFSLALTVQRSGPAGGGGQCLWTPGHTTHCFRTVNY